MKRIIIDFADYKKELNEAEAKGFRNGAAEVERIAIEMSSGASHESCIDLIDAGDSFLVKIIDNMWPRFSRSRSK